MSSSKKSISEIAFSVLDLSPYPADKGIADAFKSTRDLAQAADRFGYKRYWIAEHHSIEGIASAATSILIGHVAENTKRIRVGSGGIMLPNHAPLMVAEQFGTLALLYPDRIDLGLGRAPGSDRPAMRAIRRGLSKDADDFGDMIEELQFYFAKPTPDQPVVAIPGAGVKVPLYILGSSLYSAHLAARMGLPYAFAGHFAPAAMLAAFATYRSEFQKSDVLKKPYVMVGVPVVAGEDDAAADILATTTYQSFLNLVRRVPRQAEPPVPTMQGRWTTYEEAAVKSMLEIFVVGGPEKVKEGLQALIDMTGADELIISSNFYHHADRVRSYEIVAEVAGLKERHSEKALAL